MPNGISVPLKMVIKTINYGKAVNYAAGSSGYDSIANIDPNINVQNVIGVFLNNSGVGAVQGLQITPCFFNGSGYMFYNYYAPQAVNTTLSIVIKYYDYE